mgnify:CR=1 FL=1
MLWITTIPHIAIMNHHMSFWGRSNKKNIIQAVKSPTNLFVLYEAIAFLVLGALPKPATILVDQDLRFVTF